MKNHHIHKVVALLREEIKKWELPAVSEVAEKSDRDPFQILISCLLSLRTKDETTGAASARLFALATTPEKMAQLPSSTIEKAIYPVGFYRTKAKRIIEICRILIDQYHSRVPDEIEELLRLPGVGRKTANLVVTIGYGKPGICVDTHVHRICNRLGYVKTRSPEQTETALRKKLPPPYWIEFNDFLVTFGQNICTPVSPFCSRCCIRTFCDRLGVARSR